jgi:uncharacterized protein
MELTNDFRVSVPVDEAWAVLTDLARVGPCLPGAEVQEMVGEEAHGVVRVKVGPVSVQYKGVVSFRERDDVAHRAVMAAEGRDTRGQGTASALITAVASPDGDGTAVHVVTDLTITGKVAQFGRGVLADVSTKLLRQFVERLEEDVLRADPETEEPEEAQETEEADVAHEAGAGPAGDGAGAVDGPRAENATARPAPRYSEPEAIDLFDAAGPSIAKRVLPIAVVAIVVLILFGRRRRRRRRRRGD